VVGRALEVAEGVARAAPIATRLTKAGLAQGSRGRFELALQWEALAQPVTLSTKDIHKGVQARREHRAPTFDGD
jgi:enoyl-CoA hydratase/carnithine racemase